MSEESQPLLRGPMRTLEPESDEQSLVTVGSSAAHQTKWWKRGYLDSPYLNWLWHPIFGLILWATLIWQNCESILYRAECNVCRKKVGMVDQWTISASGGCQYCALYERVLSDMAPQIEPSLGLFMIKSESLFTKFPLQLDIWNAGRFERAKFRILAPRVVKQGTSDYPRSFDVPKDSASSKSMEFVRRAVDDCSEYHKECRKPKRPRLPKRVLDLRDFDSESDVRLYQPRGAKAQYIALSHAWGEQHTFMTTHSNFEERSQGIKLLNLPKTFQDAIFIARKLRIRYLWIDSLCIIQDDISDWEEESPKMGAIYGNAYLTIAAGSAMNDRTGFLGQRTDFMYNDFVLRAKDGPYVAICRVQDLTAPSRRDPLSLRAWAFQERLLSRRTVYYHQQEIVFECKEGIKCECMSCSRVVERYRRNESAYWKSLGLNFKASGFPRVQIPKSAGIEELHDFWRKYIVPEYSARSITRDSDRLPALSAVASTVHSMTGDRYLAGMWYMDLPSALAWTSVQSRTSEAAERNLATLPSVYVAPSWSWLSIDGSVEYKDNKVNEVLTYRVSTLNVTCISASPNAFGDVSGGSITLYGKVIYGTIESEVGIERRWPYRVKLLFGTPQQISLGFEPDVSFLAESEILEVETIPSETAPQSWLNIHTTLRREKLPAMTSMDRNGLSYGLSGDVTNERLPYGKVKCLLVCDTFRRGRIEWFFLVLGHSSQVSGAYERLGTLTCWVNGNVEWTELNEIESQDITIV